MPMEQSIQTLFFFEDGNDVSVHENVLKDLMKLMGADLEEVLAERLEVLRGRRTRAS